MLETNQLEKLIQDLESLRKSLNDLRLETELSKKDISSLQKIYAKTEILMKDYEQSLNRLNHLLDIQEIDSKSNKEKFMDKSTELEAAIERFMEQTEQVRTSIEEQSKKDHEAIETRINSLEKNQWRFAGLAGLLIISITAFLERVQIVNLIGRMVGLD